MKRQIQRLFFLQKGLCHLCGGLMVPSAKPETPVAVTKDHIIPVSLGGRNVFSNYKLAHRLCNSLRSNGPVIVLPPLELTEQQRQSALAYLTQKLPASAFEHIQAMRKAEAAKAVFRTPDKPYRPSVIATEEDIKRARVAAYLGFKP